MVKAALPANRALREPQCNFLPCALNCITSVNDIPAKQKVTSTLDIVKSPGCMS